MSKLDEIGEQIRQARAVEADAAAQIARLTEELAMTQENFRATQNRIAMLHLDLRAEAEKS